VLADCVGIFTHPSPVALPGESRNTSHCPEIAAADGRCTFPLLRCAAGIAEKPQDEPAGTAE
jgi:hypothetical protein